MTKRIRPIVFSLGAAALVAQAFVLQACGGSNNSSLTGNASGAGTAGTNGAGGTTGDAGTNGGGGTTGSAGSSATGTGGTMAFGEPACSSNVVKNGACTPADQQFCWKTCGPEKTGVKSEMCTTAGTYSEMSGCSFDQTKNYACYKIPTEIQTACPAGETPKGSDPCDVPHCTLCNSMQGLMGGQYYDSQGSPKMGWCTCQEPNNDGLRTWTCASDTSWPCPLGAGC